MCKWRLLKLCPVMPLPFKTSGSEGFIATVDIIVEEAAVVVLVDYVPLLLELLGDPVCGPEIGHPGCLVPVIGQGLDKGCVRSPDLMMVGVGVLQLARCSLPGELALGQVAGCTVAGGSQWQGSLGLGQW